MGYSTVNKLRPLRINFDIYSDSEDNEFKGELLTLMKGSVLELQVAANESVSIRNADIFRRAAHKAKSTLILLDDDEFFKAVEDLKDFLNQPEDRINENVNPRKIDTLNELCDRIVESLEKEAERYRSS
jgi:hypothetical protein